MNKLLPCLHTIALLLPLSGLFAQEAPPVASQPPATEHHAPPILEGNYLLTLTSQEKGQPATELAVVTADGVFNTASAWPNLTFAGRLLPQEGGAYLVDYSLGFQIVESNGRPVTKDTPSGQLQNMQYRQINTKSSVLLHRGETVQIIKDGDHVYTLKIDRDKPETVAERGGPGIGFMH